MGIVAFFGNYISKLGPSVIRRHLPRIGVEGILFDLNGLLHAIAQKTFMYGDGFDNEAYEAAVRSNRKSKCYMEDYVYNLGTELSKIISVLNPRQYVIICVDGVAPGAKIVQQRSRRYRDYKGDDNTEYPPLAGFRSAMISPGTPFMHMVDTYMRGWVKAQVEFQRNAFRRREKSAFPPVVVYSPHTISGEGEHKAFYFLKKLLHDFSIRQGTGSHVVYGKDADLAMLSLLSPVRNIMILREDMNQVISVEDLYSQIRSSMTNNESSSVVSLLSRETICRDFVTITTLIGNDFLPRIPSIDAKIVGSTLLDTYAKLNSQITIVTEEAIKEDPISPHANIILSSLGNFLHLLSKNESTLLKRKYLIEVESKNTEYERHPTVPLHSSIKEDNNIDINKFRKEWYHDAMNMYNLTHEKKDWIDSIGDCMNMMVCYYLASMEWTLMYYSGGGDKVNWLFNYPFVVAPTITDLAGFIISNYSSVSKSKSPNKTFVSHLFKSVHCGSQSGFTHKDGNASARGKSAITPAHQLLVITPPGLIEEVSGAPYLSSLIIDSESELSKIAPLPNTFSMYKDGSLINKPYTNVPLIPTIDLIKVIELVKFYSNLHRENYETKLAEDLKAIKRGEKTPPKERYNKHGEAVPGSLPKFKPLIPTRLESSDFGEAIYVPAPHNLKLFNAKAIGKEDEFLKMIKNKSNTITSPRKRLNLAVGVDETMGGLGYWGNQGPDLEDTLEVKKGKSKVVRSLSPLPVSTKLN